MLASVDNVRVSTFKPARKSASPVSSVLLVMGVAGVAVVCLGAMPTAGVGRAVADRGALSSSESVNVSRWLDELAQAARELNGLSGGLGGGLARGLSGGNYHHAVVPTTSGQRFAHQLQLATRLAPNQSEAHIDRHHGVPVHWTHLPPPMSLV